MLLHADLKSTEVTGEGRKNIFHNKQQQVGISNSLQACVGYLDTSWWWLLFGRLWTSGGVAHLKEVGGFEGLTRFSFPLPFLRFPFSMPPPSHTYPSIRPPLHMEEQLFQVVLYQHMGSGHHALNPLKQ